jgi:dUTP pyrophosphatase
MCNNCDYTELTEASNCSCAIIADTLQTEASYPVKIKKLTDNAKIPTRGSAEAAGYDLYADLEETSPVYIQPHETVLIKTGLAFAIPRGSFLGIYPRSGLASKKGLRPANCVGVVDSDYRGEVMVALHNDSNEIRAVENGERIAQAILQSYLPMNFLEVEELDTTDRGEGGFGSTGTK